MRLPHIHIERVGAPSKSGSLLLPLARGARRSTLVVALMTVASSLLLTTLTSCIASRRDTSAVAVPAVIATFIANPAAIRPGDSAVLAWQVTGATKLSLSDGSASTSSSGFKPVTGNSVSVTPAATTAYTLTATDASGNASSSTTTVVVETSPVISGFTANPTTIGDVGPGTTSTTTTTLKWNVTGATSLTLEHDGLFDDVSGKSSVTVSPAKDTQYTLSADNAVGLPSTAGPITVQVVNVPRPAISTFSAKPGSIGVGSNSTLSWTVLNATSLSLQSMANGTAQPPVDVSGTSSVKVSPTQATTYTLVATVVSGSFVASVNSSPVTVNVTNCPSANITSFTSSPVSTGSGAAVMLTAVYSGGPAGDLGAGTVDNNIGVINSNQPISTSPLTASTTFTLSVSNQTCQLDPTTAEVRVPVGDVSLFAGGNNGGYVDGAAMGAARFNNPNGLAVDPAGNLIVAESTGYASNNGNNQSRSTIRKITTDTSGNSTVSTLAGDGSSSGETGYVNGPAFNTVGGVPVLNALFNGPRGVAVDGSGKIYVADSTNNVIRMLTSDAGGNWIVSTIAGGPPGPTAVCSPDPDVGDSQPCPSGNPAAFGITDGPAATAQFFRPGGIAVDAAGQNIYVADTANNLVRKIAIASDGTATVSTIAGRRTNNLQPGYQDGPGLTAQFSNPQGIAVDSSGNVFLADTGNHVVRRIGAADAVVTTIAGVYQLQSADNPVPLGGYQDGPGLTARFEVPSGVAVDAAGYIYVSDTGNRAIRRIAPDAFATVTTIAGEPNATSFNTDPVQPLPGNIQSPASIALDLKGQTLYFPGANAYRIFKAPY